MYSDFTNVRTIMAFWARSKGLGHHVLLVGLSRLGSRRVEIDLDQLATQAENFRLRCQPYKCMDWLPGPFNIGLVWPFGQDISAQKGTLLECAGESRPTRPLATICSRERLACMYL